VLDVRRQSCRLLVSLELRHIHHEPHLFRLTDRSTRVRSAPRRTLLAGVILGLLAASRIAAAQVYLYDNSRGDTGLFLDPGPHPFIADTVTLASGPRTATRISVAVSGLGVSGNESLVLVLSALDGSVSPAGRPGPGRPLFTATQALTWGPGDHYATWFSFDLPKVTLPDSLALALGFEGVEEGEIAGPHLFELTTTGASDPDYWQMLGGGGSAWRTAVLGPNGVPGARFGAVIAVPEPRVVWWLTALGALTIWRLRRQARGGAAIQG
jgi:hypothetical protein